MLRTSTFLLAAVAAVAVLSLAPMTFAGNPADVANFTDVQYGSGYGQITGLSWGARGGNNYLFVCNRFGDISVIKNGTPQAGTLTTVSPCYTGDGEVGLESVMTDVDFGGGNPYVWIYVTENSGSPGPARVHRYTFADNGTVSLSNKTAIGPVMPTHGINHNGGGISQDSNGLIYAGVGNNNNGVDEGGNFLPGTNPPVPNPNVLTSLGSKIVRFDRSGNAMGGSNYIGSGNATTRFIFAQGLRNPFGVRIRPNSGNQLWMFGVGDGYEQIFHITENGNVGWPTENNQSTTNGLLIPKYAYQTGGAIGNALTRGMFYTGTSYPAAYQGNVFFCEYGQSRIFRAQMSGDNINSGSVAAFVTNASNPTDINVGPDGAIYYASSGNGQVRRVYYNGATPPTITSPPANRTVTEGQTAQFSVTAAGSGLSYQWQSMPPGGAFANIGGATGTTFTTAATTVGMNGTQYRVVVTNAAGNITSNAATLTVNYAMPTITTQPSNQSVVVPAMATFSVVATGTNRTYQWQSMPPGGAFANIGGATAASYTTPATAAGMSGTQYRVIVTNPAGSLTSSAATLTVTSANVAPSITGQPANATVTAPATATFTVTATGTAPLSYQWQAMPPGGSFANVGTNSPSYTTPATSTAMSGTQYHVTVTNSISSVTSNTVTLTVNGAPAATPSISPGGGTYSGPVTVRITTATPGAAIHYTVNNTAPTGASPTYGGPFVVSATSTVRAIATMAGMSNSAEGSAGFTITGNTAYGIPYRDPATGINIPTVVAGLPATLSATGLFQNPVSTMVPNAGMVPFGVNSPLWSDGAVKKRWIVLPGNAKITFSATNEWTFPTGTLMVKHFDLPINDTNPAQTKRLETRVFYVDQAGGTSYGATYKWRADNSEADLLTNATVPLDEIETITTATGTRTQTWSYPSRDNCLNCHNPAAATVLGPKTRQLNGSYYYPGGVTDNQLRTWNYLQMFSTPISESAIAGYDQLVVVSDVNATLEERVRSYLDANCAQCHRPGAPEGRARWDARYNTALGSMGIIDAPVLADNVLGLANPRIIFPLDPPDSMLLQRMLSVNPAVRMPQIASHVVDQEATITITAWINTLPASPNPGPGPGPGPGPAPGPGATTTASSGAPHAWGGCGLTGLDGIFLVGLAALLRRRKR